jgi:hypothetical protein
MGPRMNGEARRIRRLSRLLALAGADSRQSELALAAALREGAAAARQQARVAGLIAGTAGACGPSAKAALASAAQLRLLLQPAEDAAAGAEARAHVARRQAEARLAHSRARAARLEELLADAHQTQARVRDRKAADATIPRRPRP